MSETWAKRCRHGNSERSCDDCYNWARAESETSPYPYWKPPLRTYGRSFREYLRGDIHRVDTVVDKFDEVFGRMPCVRVRLK